MKLSTKISKISKHWKAKGAIKYIRGGRKVIPRAWYFQKEMQEENVEELRESGGPYAIDPILNQGQDQSASFQSDLCR